MAQSAEPQGYFHLAIHYYRSLLTRLLPFEAVLTGEVHDVGPQAGFPALHDSNSTSRFVLFGLTYKIDLLGLAS